MHHRDRFHKECMPHLYVGAFGRANQRENDRTPAPQDIDKADLAKIDATSPSALTGSWCQPHCHLRVIFSSYRTHYFLPMRSTHSFEASRFGIRFGHRRVLFQVESIGRRTVR